MIDKLANFLGLLILLASLSACFGSESPERPNLKVVTAVPTATSVSLDRHTSLKAIVEKSILPAHAQFAADTGSLLEAIYQFRDVPTRENLDEVQAQWRRSAESRASMEHLAFRFTMVFDNQIKKWPVDVKYIERFIADDSVTIDEQFVQSVGSTSKGLTAIEYMVFDPNLSNIAIAQRLAEDPQRMSYLVSLAENLDNTAQQLFNVWSPVGDAQAQSFLEADFDIGDPQDSMNMLANAVMAKIEEIANKGLYYPLHGSFGSPVPQAVEASYSRYSVPLMVSSLRGLKHTFNSGMSDYLDFVQRSENGESLSETINRQFEVAIAALEEITPSLTVAVDNDPSAVEAAYEEVKTLEMLFKVDLANNMGVTITYEAKDGD